VLPASRELFEPQKTEPPRLAKERRWFEFQQTLAGPLPKCQRIVAALTPARSRERTSAYLTAEPIGATGMSAAATFGCPAEVSGCAPGDLRACSASTTAFTRFAINGISAAGAAALALTDAAATCELGLVTAALAGASPGATLGGTSAAWLSGTADACAASTSL
jgi:hypothetical protein